MAKLLFTVAMCLIGTGIQCRSATAAIIISAFPSAQVVSGVGSSVSVGLKISGLGGFMPPALGAFDLNVAFDPNALQFINNVFGDPILGDQLNLSGLGSITMTTPAAGSVNLFELSLDSLGDLNSLQAPTFILSTLTFRAIAGGTSAISISSNALSDAFGDPLSANIQNGAITVSAVPEPNSLLLVLSAIVLGVGLHRQKIG